MKSENLLTIFQITTISMTTQQLLGVIDLRETHKYLRAQNLQRWKHEETHDTSDFHKTKSIKTFDKSEKFLMMKTNKSDVEERPVCLGQR